METGRGSGHGAWDPLYPILDIGPVIKHRYHGGAMWTLYDDLDAFYLEHRRCGRLDAGVENGQVWMTCECGALSSRTILPSDESLRPTRENGRS